MTEAVPSYLSPTGQEIVFLLLGAVAVGSALLVVTTRQLVHAALWLVLCFGALAGCYLVLTAEFVAWVQVLIYVGAVVVLMLFGIMLTRAPIGRSADLDSGNRVVAAVVAVATAAVLVTVVVDAFRMAYVSLTPGQGSAKELGGSVFSTWVLPFEALSVLLLAALIGAIVLSRTDIPGGPSPEVPPRPGPSSEGSVPAGLSTAGPSPAGMSPADASGSDHPLPDQHPTGAPIPERPPSDPPPAGTSHPGPPLAGAPHPGPRQGASHPDTHPAGPPETRASGGGAPGGPTEGPPSTGSARRDAGPPPDQVGGH
ncbi:NADH-quinone oxidoreductase subunit J family protein [Nonomuraea indica]|uniref:NADH-quinone oxidoreductase subunit J family protein n=1 Tax=Nonomuraea indica TaxID=1581193 RepID=UPI001FE5D154|nr:NADH-quinone oxidoreductase subunit J [Nonomuraea indica]